MPKNMVAADPKDEHIMKSEADITTGLPAEPGQIQPVDGVQDLSTAIRGSGVGRSRLPRWVSGRWPRFVVRRLLSLVLTLTVLVLATFFMVRLIPGDPAQLAVGFGGTQFDYAEMREQLGLDKPLGTQLVDYTKGILKGDLGTSFAYKQPVKDLIGSRIGYSVQLTGLGLIVMLGLSIPIGMTAAALTRNGRHRSLEAAFTAGTSIVGSLPEFLAATFLAFVFAVWFRLLPVAGVQGWKSLVLPVVAISLRPIAYIARIVRVETLNALSTDYMRTARSKRLPRRLIYTRHLLPNVLTGALTVAGLLVGGLIGGALIVENVFARPGLGTALVAAIGTRDYPMIQGLVLLLGVGVVIANTVIDAILALLNPRSMTADG
jgi:peptide/nickel transport system permease protein